ncbi:tRNA nucleotidyltransferase, CCA-adding enzyme [Methanonatronarchaeum thermophilum]|uniref:CCA-adding enzyme n=1 Tax=Methanonatronarchaeum thermophilum TaxID=1927129 RepID=A0A1Y3G9S6_9EURY|nr:CCA tRNA nucleotidyltransferase [Methanonatronarchaeum thermophilum]OUJ18191.1 tRNA nucleotidyltransferase, CCA-adding enzyme [Methanonatronarchaeum thermophilum]
MDDLENVLNQVLNKVDPSNREREKAVETIDKVKNIVQIVGDEIGVKVNPRTVGSVARGTWISGDRDIDIFLVLPKNLSEKEFRKKGLKLARKTAEHADSYVEEFAEHPYITARFGEFDVDIVPCYKAENYQEVTSAVDRTPLHDDYVSNKLNKELKNSIKLLKRFMKGIGVYGAEFKIGGFSGYLTELLALNYQKNGDNPHPTFTNTLKQASKWSYGETIDIKGYKTASSFNGPLIVIDPVDPNRNVAAALTKKRWAEFTSAAHLFLQNPKTDYFYPSKIKPYNSKKLKEIIKKRKTKLILLDFDKPEVVDDTLYPQLRKTANWIEQLLENKGFDVIRSEINGETGAYVLIELKEKNLPSVEKHYGPPVTSKKHSQSFLEKYIDNDIHSGPYIEEDRWVVERKRKEKKPTNIILERIKDPKLTGVGKDLIKTEVEILEDQEILDVNNRFLTEYFIGKPHWLENHK